MSTANTFAYDKAFFTCSACGKSNVFDYTDIEPLISGQSRNCRHCRVSARLAEDDRKVLDAQLGKGARFGKVLMIFAIPFFLIGLVLALVYGGLVTALWAGGGFVLILLLRMILSPSEKLQLKLLADSESTLS